MGNTTRTPAGSRRHDLDALRATAMLLGIALHACLSFVTFPWIVQDTRQHALFGLFLSVIHGFRMPLFFLLSGFFTAMLWRRRGIKSLLGQRVRRIVLPLALCMVTVVPIMSVVSGIAITSGIKAGINGATAREPSGDAQADIWAAARNGDVDAIGEHLANGADIRALDPAWQAPPLTFAAAFGHVEAVDFLLLKGAQVDARGAKGSTALHGAAFFGEAAVVRRLMEAGADGNVRNSDGATPADTLAADWGTTQFVAGLLQVPVDEKRVMVGREDVAAALGGADAAPVDIWTAALRGDTKAIAAQLAAGVDVDSRNPESGGTALTVAALFDHTDAVDLLLRSGADINALGADGGTALHAAAFLGHAGAARLLIEAGADLAIRNDSGGTPGDALAVDWGTTQFIANMLQLSVEEEKVMAGREEVATLFAESDPAAREPGKSKRAAGRGARPRGVQWLMETSVFHHLWFLWFLCWLLPGFALYATVADRLGWQGAPAWMVVSPLRFVWLIPLTMVPQWFMGRMPGSFGPDTSAGLLPLPQVLLYYAIFFAFGALYYDADDREGRVGRLWWVSLLVALTVAFPLGLSFSGGADHILDPQTRHAIRGVGQVAYAWAMIFGMMGLFRALLSRERPWLRYVSDASYWLYVAHLPLIIWAQMIVRDWQIPAIVKFLLVCVVVTGPLLLVYHTLVRYRWLGRFLNGPRQRPAKAGSAPSTTA